MRPNLRYATTDPAVVRALIAENPWATIVSHGPDGLVASHYPVLLDDRDDDLTVVTHVGRPDDELHRFGGEEIHCYGVPEILDADENLRVLTRLVDHFEQHVNEPVSLDHELGARVARGTVGIRLPITRFVCKVKMSQDKDEQSRAQVLEALRGSGRYANPALADTMQRALSEMPA